MSKPITPDEVGEVKSSKMPPEVFDAFNECIAKHWDGRSANFTQKEALAAILAKLPDETSETVYENRWLDVEELYRRAGWHVDYDRPGYCETYEANFTFKRRSRGSGTT